MKKTVIAVLLVCMLACCGCSSQTTNDEGASGLSGASSEVVSGEGTAMNENTTAEPAETQIPGAEDESTAAEGENGDSDGLPTVGSEGEADAVPFGIEDGN